MENMPDLMAIISARAEAAMEKNPNDYVLPDGLLYCGKCHTPKQCRPKEDQPELIVYCICDCVRKQQDEMKQRRKSDEETKRRNMCFMCADGSTQTIIRNTFDNDDSPESEQSKVSRGYVGAFQYHNPRQWLLYIGGNGIGKSFYAACICNSLIDKGYICKFTSISDIAAQVWDAEKKSEVYSRLCRNDLIVIDDFGAERDTEYMRDIQFNVFDSLLRSNAAAIITTNLSPDELLNPQSKDMKRIASRIFERSVPIPFAGEDRRKKSMERNAEKNRQKLKGSAG